MRTNKRQEQLLDNKFQLYLDEDENIEEIQMTDFKALNKNAPKYVKLEDQSSFLLNEGHQSSHFYSKNPKNKTEIMNNYHQNIFTDKPVVPTTSYNFQPNQIFINGTTFVHKDAIKGMIKTQNKVKKPEMQVACEFCFSVQMVPANTHSFICFNCDITQGCNPQFGIVICGSCQRKVWYPLGTSDLIKCTKCGTINKIPFVQNYIREESPYKFRNEDETSLKEGGFQNQLNLTEKYFIKRHPI